MPRGAPHARSARVRGGGRGARRRGDDARVGTRRTIARGGDEAVGGRETRRRSRRRGDGVLGRTVGRGFKLESVGGGVRVVRGVLSTRDDRGVAAAAATRANGEGRLRRRRRFRERRDETAETAGFSRRGREGARATHHHHGHDRDRDCDVRGRCHRGAGARTARAFAQSFVFDVFRRATRVRFGRRPRRRGRVHLGGGAVAVLLL